MSWKRALDRSRPITLCLRLYPGKDDDLIDQIASISYGEVTTKIKQVIRKGLLADRQGQEEGVVELNVAPRVCELKSEDLPKQESYRERSVSEVAEPETGMDVHPSIVTATPESVDVLRNLSRMFR